ncbi:MAG TPA: heparan-alpha-glucosaminide N-acetyltransferase domain-containing protein [Candidatus Binatia bacterium]|nr:heparan-alpha-glucosaminide N-acetyltransferase domain-containing protein [Candidatus Binatia bacterium]
MPTQSASPAPVAARLTSLDALRGFDMFWIMGGDSLAAAFGGLSQSDFVKGLSRQLEHCDWAGFRFYDMIFPLFVFIVGVSLVLSLSRTIEQHGRAVAVKRILRRSLLLFVVALFYSGGFANSWPDIRLLGVLNRLALCYFFASLIYCFVPWRGMIAVCAALLVGYWALMTFVPFPDVRPVEDSGRLISDRLTATNTSQLNWTSTNMLKGVFEPGLNLANYVDQKYLPGKKWDKTWDPEGLLSTLPAIASCLLGVFAGLLLQNSRIDDRKKVTWLFASGVAGVMAGFAWGAHFPVIKKIWTSSYVLVAGGYSAILLGLFYLIVDVLKYQKWCQVFVWYGMNPITVYLADNVLSFRRVATRLLGTDVKAFLDANVTAGFGDLVLSFGEIGVGLCLVWFLYRRRIFLRL